MMSLKKLLAGAALAAALTGITYAATTPAAAAPAPQSASVSSLVQHVVSLTENPSGTDEEPEHD